MRIDRLSLTSFGRFHGRTLELEPGLNIIYGHNEAGKTTIGKFILGMMYGFKKKGQRREFTEDALKYRPWEGGDYRGAMVYGLDRTGRSYRVERAFDPQRDEVFLYDAVTGADLTERFPMDRRKEILFMEEQLKLPEEVFRSTAWVGQLEVGKLEMGRELVARVANMQESGRDDLSVKNAIRLLEEQMREIGTERAPTRPYARVTRLMEDKKDELERALAAREETRGWEGALTEIRATLAEIDRELASLAGRLDLALLGEAEERLARALQSSKAAREARTRAIELERYRNFPIEHKERLTRLSAEVTALDGALARQRARLAELAAQSAELHRGIERYPGMAAGGAEMLSEIEVALQLVRTGNDPLPALREEAARLTEMIERLDESIAPLKATAEQGAAVLAQLDVMEQEVTRLRMRQPDAAADNLRAEVNELELRLGKTGGWIHLILAVLFGGAAGAVAVPNLGVAEALGLSGSLTWAALGSTAVVAVGFLSLFIIARVKAARLAAELKEARSNLKTVSDRLAEQQDQVIKLEREKAHLLESLGVATPGEIRNQTVRYEQLVARRDGQKVRLDAVLGELNRNQEDVTQRRQRLARMLAKALNASPQELAAEPDAVGRFRRAHAEYTDLRQRLDAVRREYGELEGRVREQESALAGLNAEIRTILAEGGVADAEAFQEGCARRDAWAKAAAEAETLEAALRAHLGGESPEVLEVQVERLRLRTRGQRPEEPLESGQIQAEIRRLEARRAELDSRASDLSARVETSLKDLADTADIQREIDQLAAERRAFDAELAALDLAARTITEVSAQIHREFAPKLHGAMGRIVSEVTGGKYRQVRIDEELGIKAVTSTDRTVDLTSLSGGTIDQFYFGLRVALLDLISEGQEKCPLILDDPFVQYDEQRLRNSMEFLAELARERQIILMTCHLREVRMAREVGGQVGVIDISDEQVVEKAP